MTNCGQGGADPDFGSNVGVWLVKSSIQMQTLSLLSFIYLFNIRNITQLQNMSLHLFQQWITDIYKYTCTGYAYIMNKKVQKYR